MDPTAKQRQKEEEEARSRLATRLREAREYLGLSQDQVAQHIGISRSALSNIETGQRKVEVVELTRLAALYKRPVAHFTGETLAPPGDELPADVEHLARKASKLTPKDRGELARFADFLRMRSQPEAGGDGQGGSEGGQ
jgi:transcriptional regulator with XRE-family HTH domain